MATSSQYIHHIFINLVHILYLLDYQNAVAKRLDNRQLLSFDSDAIGRSNLFFLHVFPRLVGVTQTLQLLSHYSSQCIAIYPSDIYIQNVSQITSQSTDKLPQRASLSSARTVRSAQTSISGKIVIQDEDLINCPNLNFNMTKREIPDQQSTTMFYLAWYSSNTIRMNKELKLVSKNTPIIYGFYTTTKDDLINIVSVSLDQLLSLHKKYVTWQSTKYRVIWNEYLFLDIYLLHKLLKQIQNKSIKYKTTIHILNH